MAKKNNNYYFDTFEKGVSYACEAAALLGTCFEQYDPSGLKTRMDEMHTIEHTADGVKHEMMEKLLKQKRSVAIVVDEFGGTAGLVTLEDLVEEIFGEIEDEHDRMRFIAKEIEPGVYQFSGRMEIEEINEEYPLELPESDEYQTLAGYLLYQMEVVPQSGDKIEVDGRVFTIEKMVGARIDLVRVEVKEKE